MLERLGKIEKRNSELEQLLSSPEVIADKNLYNKYARELSGLRESVVLSREYKKVLREQEGLESVFKEKHEQEFVELAKSELQELKAKRAALEEKIKLELEEEDPYAGKDIIVEIRQGTGGLEAALFAADLYRMYTKYADSKGWTAEIMSSHPTEGGGFKEVVFGVRGIDAYKRLKFESGVHRVQRVPDTEAQGRIHTSTATVVVLVEPEEVDLVINPNDLRIDTYRSSGAGGQNVQKNDTAVRITHVPTNTVVACQDERSQLKNKNKAMRILRTRLLDMRRQEEFKKVSEARRSQIGTGDRNEKIRTYNFPDRRVTDHRINFTSFRLEAIMDGALEEFSEALIKAAREKKEEAEKAK